MTGRAFAGAKPQHRVWITRPFYLGVTEVTRGQFRRFVDETGYRTEAEKDGKGGWGWNEEAKTFEQDPKYTWRNPGFEQTDEHPVVNVSWNDAVAFVAWLSRKEGEDLPACRPRRNGNMPAGPGRRRRYSSVTIRRAWRRWGTSRTGRRGKYPMAGDDRGAGRLCLHGPGGSFRRTTWGCTTCTGMSGSGVRTISPTTCRRSTTRRALPRCSSG